MNLYLDTEFNGFGGDLISMALVTQWPHIFFYEVLKYDHLKIDPWVAKNVIPVLEKEPVDMDDFQWNLRKFLASFSNIPINIVADWPEDIAHFCKALITGPGFRIPTPPITFEIKNIDYKSEVPHNAAYDALAMMKECEQCSIQIVP